ncbi:MAG: hypothetical protein ABFD89_02600, partial [Bryobacteraceae bacterium]
MDRRTFLALAPTAAIGSIPPKEAVSVILEGTSPDDRLMQLAIAALRSAVAVKTSGDMPRNLRILLKGQD